MKIEQRHAATNCSGRFSLACALRANAHAPYIPGRHGLRLIALALLPHGVRGRLPLLTTFNSIKLHDVNIGGGWTGMMEWNVTVE